MKKLTLLTTAGLLGIGALVLTSLLAQTNRSNVTDEVPVTRAQADHANMPMPKEDVEAASGESVKARGTVQNVEKGSRKVTLAHDAIPEWEWPKMTMSFDVDDAVDLSKLQQGAEVEFEAVRAEEGRTVITGLHLVEE